MESKFSSPTKNWIKRFLILFKHGPFDSGQLIMISNVQQISIFLAKFNNSVEGAAIKALRSHDMVAFFGFIKFEGQTVKILLS